MEEPDHIDVQRLRRVMSPEYDAEIRRNAAREQQEESRTRALWVFVWTFVAAVTVVLGLILYDHWRTRHVRRFEHRFNDAVGDVFGR